MKTLTVIIHTYNSEKYLSYVLDSIKFANEIIIADMGSSDKTIKIAKKYNSRIINIRNEGFADPARPKIYKLAKSDYVLVLDSDEIVSNTLKEKILNILENNSNMIYSIPRLNWMLGKRINPVKKGPYSYDRQVRLSPKGSLTYTGKVHEQPVIKKGYEVTTLDITEGHIEHFSHLGSSDIIRRGDSYAHFEALRALEQNKSVLTQPYHLVRFIIRWIRAKIYMQGYAGWLYLITDIIYRINVMIKIYEYKKFKSKSILDIYLQYLKSLK